MGYNLITPINQLGYGIAGLNLLYETIQTTHVALHMIGGLDPNDMPAKMVDAFKTAKQAAMSYHPYAPSVRIWHEGEQSQHVGRGEHYAFPFFEIDPLTKAQLHHLNLLDGLIVASDWAKDVAIRSGINVPVCIVPLGVDRNIFHENVKVDRLETDHTVFVNVGKWEYRKGHDFLLKCFNKAFEPTDKVMLRMLCQNPFIGHENQDWGIKYKTSKMGGRIQLLDRVKGQAGVARVMAASDVGVFPYRAEGWNLDLLECLSMGLHCIATGYSAPTEYLDDDNCTIIKVDGMEKAEDGRWFHGEGQWANLGEDQEEECVEMMRAFHRWKQQGGLGRNDAGIETAKRFTWRRSAAELLKAIGEEKDG